MTSTKQEPQKRWLVRKWRSISFRSGAGAAFVVGAIAAAGLLLLLFVIYISVFFSGAVIQASVMNRVSDQLRLGVEPDEVDIDGAATELFLDDGFWAILQDGEIISSAPRSDVPIEEVLAAPFSDTDVLRDREDAREMFEVAGTKSLDGDQWLILQNPIPDTRLQLVTGAKGDFSFLRFLRDNLLLLVPALIGLTLVAGLVTSWFARRALGSVEKIRAEVEHITNESLDRRVPTTDSGDRVDKLAETMNAMLERLEQSADQQSQFLADASHELRSPVAGLVAQLEVASAYPDRTDTAVLLPKLEAEVKRLQLLLDDLLFLSRSEANLNQRTPSPRDRVDIGMLLDREVEHQQLLHPSLEISASASTQATVSGNERDLARALRNLTDNAVRHANSHVEITATDSPGGVTIGVADDGDGIDEHDADRIFDRFVRLDESRSRDAGGAGLGLAIVDQIASAHGGRISVSAPDGPGAVFELELPTH